MCGFRCLIAYYLTKTQTDLLMGPQDHAEMYILHIETFILFEGRHDICVGVCQDTQMLQYNADLEGQYYLKIKNTIVLNAA